jgi:predicted DNA-binding protein (MmcQ/YjbR family)
MNAESIRRFCLSFPNAKENLQWGETLCFKVGGKIFAMLNLDSVPQRLCLKSSAERFAELVEQDGIVPAPYVGRYKWVLLERLDVIPEAELEDLIRQSYEMVAAKLPKTKKTRKSLKLSKKKRRRPKS